MTIVAGWCSLDVTSDATATGSRASEILSRQWPDARGRCVVADASGAIGWQSDIGSVEHVEQDGVEVLLAGTAASLNIALPKSCRHALSSHAIAESWAKTGSNVLDHLIGDFALIVRQRANKEIWLARSPLSSRPLFFRCDEKEISFATLPFALADGCEVDVDAMLRWCASLAGSSFGSMVKGVRQVQPGTAWHFRGPMADVRPIWDITAIQEASDEDEIAARTVRDVFEDAVSRACEISNGQVGSLLSGGRDSSTVSLVAAKILAQQGRTLHCYTASPGDDPRMADHPLFVDEGPTAARTAATQPNIVHHIVTPRGFRACEALDRIYRFHSTPLGNPLSLYWWDSIQQAAAADGVTVLLGGGMGNLTISDGGPVYLPDLLGRGHVGKWQRHLRDAARFPGTSTASLLKTSFGGFVPRWAYHLVQRISGRQQSSTVAPFLQPSSRERLLALFEAQDHRPPRSARRKTQELIRTTDFGDVVPNVLHGLSMRDPTADRQVIDACLRLRPDQIVSAYDRRPIFELAFGDLVPREVARAPRRAYQSMDWNLAYDLDDIRDGLSRYSRHALAREMVDFAALEKALERWPTDRAPTLAETMQIGDGLMRGLSLAAFLNAHFPG